MQTYSGEEQLSMFDPDTWCGKTSLEPLAQGSPRGRTSASSSKKSSELRSIPYMSLDLTPGAGNLLGEFFWEILSPWRGAALMLNSGVSPREEQESFLWQILEDKPHPKYYLTKRACLGILRRASERGKPLPEQLRIALEIQAGLREDVPLTKGKTAFATNQRDEVRDLHGIAGALATTHSSKQTTLVAAGICAEPSKSVLGIDSQEECAPTLKSAEKGPSILCLNDQGGQIMDCSENITGTLRAQMHSHQPLILESNQEHAQVRTDGISPMLPASMGMGGEYVPMVYENHGIDARYTGPHEVSPTISARCGTGGNNVPLVEQPPQTFCISGNIVDRKPYNGGNGMGINEDVAFSLTTADRHAVYSRQRVDVFQENEVASTESARQHKDATDLVAQPYQETVGTLVKSDHKGISNQYVSDDKCIVDGPNLIRRLSPLECERLQGFPDGWTNIPGASDSARYKALGNSVAIPCVEYVIRGIAMVLWDALRRQGIVVIIAAAGALSNSVLAAILSIKILIERREFNDTSACSVQATV